MDDEVEQPVSAVPIWSAASDSVFLNNALKMRTSVTQKTSQSMAIFVHDFLTETTCESGPGFCSMLALIELN